jgi:SAM-dependent methyltransferase
VSDKDYDTFAWFFNRHWVTDIAPDILIALDQILLPQLQPEARVLDLCCGTGQIAAELSKRGFKVMGLDNSPEMLRYARENAPDVKFVVGDARAFKTTSKFDAIVSTFDSMNHFLSLDQVEMVFRSARRALKRQGLFVFDINTEKAFTENLSEDSAIVEDDNVCVLRGSYNRKTKVGRYDITMFRLVDSEWERSDAMIEEKYYSLIELNETLKRAGFISIKAFNADKHLDLEGHEGRVFFVCS